MTNKDILNNVKIKELLRRLQRFKIAIEENGGEICKVFEKKRNTKPQKMGEMHPKVLH